MAVWEMEAASVCLVATVAMEKAWMAWMAENTRSQVTSVQEGEGSAAAGQVPVEALLGKEEVVEAAVAMLMTETRLAETMAAGLVAARADVVGKALVAVAEDSSEEVWVMAAKMDSMVAMEAVEAGMAATEKQHRSKPRALLW